MQDRREIFTEIDYHIRRQKYDEPIFIHGLSDFHYGHLMFSQKAMTRWIDNERASFEEGSSHAIFLGDVLNDYRYTDQVRIEQLRAMGTDIPVITERAKAEMDEVFEQLRFMKGRVLCCLEGNHGLMLPEGYTVDEYLASKFSCKYGGAVADVSIRIHVGKKMYTVGLLAFHGTTAAKRIGATMHELEDVLQDSPHVQIVMAGHSHRLVAGKLARRTRKFGETSSDEEMVVTRTGSFKMTYYKDSGDYSTKKRHRPSVMSMPYITLTPRRDDGDGYIDIRVTV